MYAFVYDVYFIHFFFSTQMNIKVRTFFNYDVKRKRVGSEKSREALWYAGSITMVSNKKKKNHYFIYNDVRASWSSCVMYRWKKYYCLPCARAVPVFVINYYRTHNDVNGLVKTKN